jgi:hypothetical protein
MNNLLFDATPSVRTKDENGFLHVALTPISKATVNPYLGREIDGSAAHGFKPDAIYYGLRDPKELEKAADTFNGLPLLLEHHPTDAENLPKEWVVGSMGTDAVYEKPYLKNSMTVTDAQAIGYIEDGTAKEISCSYRFTPDFTAGTYTEADGSEVHYDFVMRDIRGNHVALVPEGRAGHDVHVADSGDAVNINRQERRDFMPLDDFISKFLPLASEEEKQAAKAALEALTTAKDEDPAFAEGVSYGEEVEKKEPLKLDSEHEAEGMEAKEAEDACGKDEELPTDEDNLDELMKDPKFKAAFEMGVKYGEKREKADPERIDADHEREGMERVLGEDSIKAIEQRVTKKLRHINDAAKKVRPLVGEIANPFAFDSAEAVYSFALEKAGKDIKKYPEAAYEGMVDMVLEHKPMAVDSVAGAEACGDADEYIKALKAIRK